MKTHCISHSKDVDGLSAAALVHAARGGSFALTNYDGLFECIDAIPEDIDDVIICDLGTDSQRLKELLPKLGALAGRAGVTYIDHHYIDEESKGAIKKAGVNLVHDVNDCAGMLVYETFKAQLPAEARLVALYAAVTDYMDNSVRAKKMMERFDRQLVLLEATLLSHAVAKRGESYAFLERVVEQLSKMKRPHSMPSVNQSAVAQAETLRRLDGRVGRFAVKLEKLAYVKTKERSTGNIAKMLLGVFDVPVGIAFKQDREAGTCEVSLRGTSDCRVHLGKEISRIAMVYGGNGGGHELAAGCTVKTEKIEALLHDLDAVL